MAKKLRPLLAIALSISWLPALALDPYRALPPPDELNAAIDREGARTVLCKGSWSDGESHAFDSLLDKVRTGEDQWLRIAVRLILGSDAGVSEGLDGAMSDALPRAPEAILRLCTLGNDPGSFSIPSICSGRFNLWAEEPPEKARKWYERAERAISGLKSRALEAKRSACLSEIHRSSQRFEEVLKHDARRSSESLVAWRLTGR